MQYRQACTYGNMFVFQCSVSCGAGYQKRTVSCTAVPSAPNLQGFGVQSYTQVLPSKCPQPPPPNTQPCQLPVCLLPVYWKAGPWSKVCECICVINHASVLTVHAICVLEIFVVLKYAYTATHFPWWSVNIVYSVMFFLSVPRHVVLEWCTGQSNVSPINISPLKTARYPADLILRQPADKDIVSIILHT